MLHKVAVVLSAAVMLLVALPASADSGSITDPKGDATGCLEGAKADCDIVAAAWGHKSHGRLMHKVTVNGTLGRASGHGAEPRLMINVPGQKFDNPTCDYFVGLVPPGVGPNSSNDWKWYVQTCQNTGAQVRGPAAFVYPNSHTVRLVFKRKRIGSPSHYGWQWVMPGDGDHPPYDQAPNKGYKRHNI
jgi:hypothetical protein